jgi:hypothetical protein
VAWSALVLAMAWDTESIEEAILLATSIREEALSPGRAWACGMAEGELEPLAPDGQRMQLAWGEALLSATSLARVARPGEALVDGDTRAVRAGQLTLIGPRSSTDAGRRVRGWRLDLEHPWKPHKEGALVDDPSSEVLRIVESSALEVSAEDEEAPSDTRPRGGRLIDRVRALSQGEGRGDSGEVLSELRRARARAEGGPAVARCQAALALAMTLFIAGRLQESLLEGLDALARGREAHDAKAVAACQALLAKLYACAGYPDAAAQLKSEATGA